MQTIGRAARNVNAKVILYADRVTDAMQRTIEETARRRAAAGRIQPRARHHAGDDQEGDLRGHRSRGGRPRRGERQGRPHRRDASTSPRSTSPSSKPRCSPRPRRWNSSGRRRFATASASCATRSASRWPRCASANGEGGKKRARQEENGRPGGMERPRAAAEKNALMSFLDFRRPRSIESPMGMELNGGLFFCSRNAIRRLRFWHETSHTKSLVRLSVGGRHVCSYRPRMPSLRRQRMPRLPTV